MICRKWCRLILLLYRTILLSLLVCFNFCRAVQSLGTPGYHENVIENKTLSLYNTAIVLFLSDCYSKRDRKNKTKEDNCKMY